MGMAPSQDQGQKLRTNMSAPDAPPADPLASSYLARLGQAAQQAATAGPSFGGISKEYIDAFNKAHAKPPDALPALPPDLADQVNQNAVASERQRQLSRKGRAASFLSDSYAPTSLPPMSLLGK